MSEVSPELVERMVALVTRMAGKSSIGASFKEESPISWDSRHYDEARAIADHLPKPVDPDLIEARELVAAAVAYGRSTYIPLSPSVDDFRSGAADAGTLIANTLAAIKRGRELAGDPA
jgi:hypothetical protein